MIKLKFYGKTVGSRYYRYLLINQIDYRNNYRKSSGERRLLLQILLTEMRSNSLLKRRINACCCFVLAESFMGQLLLFHYILPKTHYFLVVI